MAEVRAFRGWRYNPAVAGEGEALLAPPYDIIGPEQERALRDRSDFNIVHLELPEGSTEAGAADNRYARAAARFGEWRERGALRREDAPALYVYAQEFTLPTGEQHRRLGILGALKVEPYERGVVLPHERTFPKHKEDRFRLLSAARAQFSPIMGLYAAEGSGARARLEAAASGPPAIHGTDAEGVRHSLWAVDDPAFVEWFRGLLGPRQVFIADGHHRYETALRHQAERGAAEGEWPDHLLVYLVQMEDPGLALMPTHRLVRGLPDADPARLREALSSRLDVRPAVGGEVAPGTVRALLSDGPALDLRARGGETLTTGQSDSPLASLEAAVLRDLIFAEVLQAGEGLEVVYTRDPAEAAQRVASGKFQAAFLLPAPRVEQLRAIALAGERMPEKTTYFWPKAYAGLVVYGEGSL